MLEIAEITFEPNRWPVPSITGASRPTGLQDLPARCGRSASPSHRPKDHGFLGAQRALLDHGVARIQRQRATISWFCSERTRERSFCGLNPHARRCRPTVVLRDTNTETPLESARTPKPAFRQNPGRRSWSRVLRPDRLRDLRLLPRQKRHLLSPPADPACPPRAPHPHRRAMRPHPRAHRLARDVRTAPRPRSETGPHPPA